MLQNVRVTAFTVSGLLRENQQGGITSTHPPRPPPQIRVDISDGDYANDGDFQ